MATHCSVDILMTCHTGGGRAGDRCCAQDGAYMARSLVVPHVEVHPGHKQCVWHRILSTTTCELDDIVEGQHTHAKNAGRSMDKYVAKSRNKQ